LEERQGAALSDQAEGLGCGAPDDGVWVAEEAQEVVHRQPRAPAAEEERCSRAELGFRGPQEVEAGRVTGGARFREEATDRRRIERGVVVSQARDGLAGGPAGGVVAWH